MTKNKIYSYNVDRAVILNPVVEYPPKKPTKSRNDAIRLFFVIPDKVRRTLKITKYNSKDFKVIIVRK